MVIVAIPSFGEGGLNQNLSPRFGRCDCFTFVTIEDKKITGVKTVPNHASSAMGGAGIQATQIIGNNGANDVIVGFLGPNAVQSLNSLKLNIFQAPNQQITIKEVVELYLKGQLQKTTAANVGTHHGMGGGRGMGGGGGGRRQL